MNPESRSRAGLAAMILAVVLLIGALWMGFGTGGPGEDPDGMDGPGSEGRELAGSRAVKEANALSQKISEAGEPEVPKDLAFVRADAGETAPQPPRERPGVAALAGRIEEEHVLLSWEATGDEPAAEYLVERLDEDGKVLATANVTAGETTFRDGPVDAVTGVRIYRVTALGHEGAAGGAEQRAVRYRLPVRLLYLRAEPDGRAWFSASVGKREPVRFAAAPGEEIGEMQAKMDWRTGWRFVALRGTRQVVTKETKVVRFAPDGRIRRHPETGEILTEKRAMPVVAVTEGAVVLPPDSPDVERWLPKSED